MFSGINPHCGILGEQKGNAVRAYAQSFSQKEMMFEQMLESRNQKEMRIVKMTMTETKKK